MKYPALADEIFGVLKYDEWKTPSRIANEVNENVDRVSMTIREMKVLKPEWFKIDQYKAMELHVVKLKGFQNDMHLWSEEGGFVNYQKEIDNDILRQQTDRKLETENLRLQNESLEYQATLRKQEAEIRSLTESNLRLQNKNLKRYILFFIFGSVVTFIITNWQWLLQLLRQVFQK